MKKNTYLNKKVGGQYLPLISLSPYKKYRKNKVNKPKFTFRTTENLVNKVIKNPKKWLDVGCANAEMIFYLAEIYKTTEFVGVDVFKKFIDLAKKNKKHSSNINFILGDCFKINKSKFKSDVVTCLGTFSIFPDPKLILNKLLDFVEPGGVLVADGRFNPHDVSAVIKFRDESNKISKNLWRCDFNIHSQAIIKKIILKRTDIKDIKFIYPVMDTKILKNKNSPHINAWTSPLKKGKYNIFNGLGLVNPSFLVIRKK